MGWFMDVLDLLIVAFLLGAGMTCAIIGARMLRRGDAVTAEEAVNWRRGVRKQGFNASADMNPDITDILVRAWRTLQGWYLLCLGIGGILGGVIATFVWMVTDLGRERALVLFALLVVILYPSIIVGAIVGLTRIPRERPAVGVEEPLLRLIRRSRLPIPAWYPAVALVANVVFMMVLVLRLAPGLDSVALARAFGLPGMWSVSVVPAFVLAVVVSMLLVRRWIVSLAPLRLPQDADARQQSDIRLRQLALGTIYIAATNAVWMALFAQGFLLMIGVYPNLPLVQAGMEDWYFFYFIPVMLGFLWAQLVLLAASATPLRRQERRAHRRGETAAQSQQ